MVEVDNEYVTFPVTVGAAYLDRLHATEVSTWLYLPAACAVASCASVYRNPGALSGVVVGHQELQKDLNYFPTHGE